MDAPAADPEAANPSGTHIFTGHLFRVRDGRGWSFTDEPPPPPPVRVRRPARVARMLALAHRLQAAIDAGDYRDRVELARQFGVTRARVTQLLNLTLLAPDIQEAVLHLEEADGSRPVSERALRKVAWTSSWADQRRIWTKLL